jgi:hypothetical protein
MSQHNEFVVALSLGERYDRMAAAKLADFINDQQAKASISGHSLLVKVVTVSLPPAAPALPVLPVPLAAPATVLGSQAAKCKACGGPRETHIGFAPPGTTTVRHQYECDV